MFGLSLIATHRLRALERADAALLAARRACEVEHEARESADALLRTVLRGLLREMPDEHRAHRSPETQARLDRLADHYAHQRADATAAPNAEDPTCRS
jgi:hypothetical protein